MLIGTLADGPVDIVGDVHGELGVLRALMTALGYDGRGRHPDGRMLVFVGDLVDRGPDNVAVIALVRSLIDDGRAQCVLGNHELNILRNDKKDGNDWFFSLSQQRRQPILDFFATLPVALERDDLRVVHACWHDDHVARLRGARANVIEAAAQFAKEIERRLEVEGVAPPAEVEPHDSEPMPAVALNAASLSRQNDHPIKVLTSGLEEPCAVPFCAGGRWRTQTRTRWWDTYRGPMVIVGHYWRSRHRDVVHGKGPDIFAGIAPEQTLGLGHVMCVDYAIGYRIGERRAGTTDFKTALAAYRWTDGTGTLEFSPG